MRQLAYYILTIIVLLSFNACGVKKRTANAHVDHSKHEKSSVSKGSDLRQHYAMLMNTNPKELNETLYKYIDAWMGSPHRMGGQSKDGIDCSGFVGLIYKEVYGKTLPRSSREMGEVVKRKYDDQLQEGDLVFFSFGGKNIDHVGVYLHNDRFIHVSTKQGVVISNLKDAWYYKYMTRCGTPQI